MISRSGLDSPMRSTAVPRSPVASTRYPARSSTSLSTCRTKDSEIRTKIVVCIAVLAGMWTPAPSVNKRRHQRLHAGRSPAEQLLAPVRENHLQRIDDALRQFAREILKAVEVPGGTNQPTRFAS